MSTNSKSYNREYYLRNKQKLRIKKHLYYLKNAEKFKARAKQWRAEHREYTRQVARKQVETRGNEYYRERMRWYNARKRAKARLGPGASPAEIQALMRTLYAEIVERARNRTEVVERKSGPRRSQQPRTPVRRNASKNTPRGNR